ncbi:hypothetical protein ACFRAM_15080 [Paenibacillus sp. NPDC056722]|uniref:hypothetical protein n=1 Tax=Paenibacillus sp. NPDC056722 TaxID=3345924 RepID=UPI00369E7AFB
MNDFRVLKLLDRLEGLFSRVGIDYGVMRSILQVKLTMDGRRAPTVLAATQRSAEPKEGSPFRPQWVYLIMGTFLIPLIIPSGHYMLQMSLVLGVVMFMITTTLVSDFSSVLLDIRDKNILFSKPVNRRTLNMAKNIHVLIYLFTLTISLAGPTLIVSLFRQGPLFFLLYCVAIVLMDCFILVITGLLYLLILKLFDGERLKDIINYVQIVLMIAITVGYQLISRLFNLAEFSASFKPAWWQYLIPPVWFAAPFELAFGGGRGIHFSLLSGLAIILPLLLIITYIKLMPQFEKNLQKLSAQEVGGREAARLSGWLSTVVCRNREEGMFFRFTWSMMKTERDFKLKVYPTLGFSIVFPFIFILNMIWLGDGGGIGNSKAYLWIYFSATLMMTIVQMLRYSGSYKGAWIYKAIPLPGEHAVYRGMLKAALLRLFIPIFLAEAVVFTVLFGIRILPDLVVVLFATLIYAVVCFLVLPRSLPFSERFEAAKQKEFTGSSFLMLFLLIGMVGLHYLATLLTGGVYIYLVLLAAFNFVFWRRTFPEGKRMEPSGMSNMDIF